VVAAAVIQVATMEAMTDMVKTNFIIGLLALAFFANAQYQGWNLFDRNAGAQTSRMSGGHGSGGSGRTSHK
jgi:hypothetical protein